MIESYGGIRVIDWSFDGLGVQDKWSGMQPPPNICDEDMLVDTWYSAWYGAWYGA